MALDETSIKLGQLLAAADEASRQRTALFEILDDIKSAHATIVLKFSLVAQEVDDMKPVVERLEKMEQRTVGAAKVLVVISALIGGGLTLIIQYFKSR